MTDRELASKRMLTVGKQEEKNPEKILNEIKNLEKWSKRCDRREASFRLWIASCFSQ